MTPSNGGGLTTSRSLTGDQACNLAYDLTCDLACDLVSLTMHQHRLPCAQCVCVVCIWLHHIYASHLCKIKTDTSAHHTPVMSHLHSCHATPPLLSCHTSTPVMPHLHSCHATPPLLSCHTSTPVMPHLHSCHATPPLLSCHTYTPYIREYALPR